MSYDPATDLLALLRTTPGGVRTERMPGLDYVIEALSRAGLITLFVGQSAPTMNQATTVWFQPAVPSWTGEGVVFLFNAVLGEFQQATPALWANLITDVFPATAAPLVDGTASVGVSLLYARQDHVHPTDTSRAPLASPVFTGTPQGPTAALGDDSANLATTSFVIANGGLPPPIGAVLPFAGATVPANWALANGAALSRTGATVNLFNTIGITYGAGDGVTTFNIPDLRGRVVAGVDAGANRLTTATMTSQALAGVNNGVSGETQTLTAAQIPSITTVQNAGFNVSVTSNVSNIVTGTIQSLNNGTNTGGVFQGIQNNTASSGGIVSVGTVAAGNVTASSNNTGGGAHPNVQPTMELNYIIRIS